MLSSCASLGLGAANTLARLGDYHLQIDVAYGKEPLQRLDIYRPTAEAENAPVVLFFYGGCWGGCTTFEKAYYRFVADTLTSVGYIAVIADYRRYPEVTIEPILADAAAATEWVVENLVRSGESERPLFLMGHSAGAHLAAMLSVDEQRLAPDTHNAVTGFIGLAGPYDFLPLTKPYQVKVFAPPQRYAKTQPINFLNGNEPPMLLLWGADDETVYRRNIENMAAKAAHVGVPVRQRIYPGMGHVDLVSALARPYRGGSPVWADIKAFISAKR